MDKVQNYISKEKTIIKNSIYACLLLSFFLLLGGSIGGIDTGVLKDDLFWGTTVVVRTETDGLPAELERTDGVCSTKFRPN